MLYSVTWCLETLPRREVASRSIFIASASNSGASALVSGTSALVTTLVILPLSLNVVLSVY